MESNLDPVDDLDSADISDQPQTMIDAGLEWARRHGAEYQPRASALAGSVVGETHAACRKCGGSGRYAGPSQYGRECFACHGTGKGLSLKPTAVKARERTAQKKANRALSIAQQAAAFREANADIVAWIAQNPRYDFAQNMAANIVRYGNLTNSQQIVIRRNIASSAERQAAYAAERQARAVNVAGLGFTKLLACFEAAKLSGLKNPTLSFERVCFKYAKKYPGSLYVTADKGYGSTFYGRIEPDGKFDPRRDTPPSVIELVKAIGADPFGQAVAHGKRTGNCCCCGRELTNPESLDLGIGPICRDRWGM